MAVVVALRGRVPDPASVGSVLAHADPMWLAAAAAAQALSQAGFALQQRTLLSALGTGITRGDAMALTFTRTAMSSVLPAGSAMSAAFALQQFRRRGASAASAATAVVLSGAASAIGLALLYAVTFGVPALADVVPARAAEVAGTLLALAVVSCLIVRVRPPSHHATAYARRRRSAPARGPVNSSIHRPATTASLSAPSRGGRRRLDRAIAQARRMAAEARTIRARHWSAAVGYAVLNWTLDLACLVAVAQACDFPLGPIELASVYLAVQLVRQIPITPGGIGLIEASLLAGFLAAGALEAEAAAVVLGYRILSFWLMLPVGLGAYWRMNRHTPKATPEQPGGAPGQAGGVPGQAGGVPGQAGGVPGQAGGVPGQAGGVPGQAGGVPGQPGGVLGQPGGAPELAGAAPELAKGASGLAGAAPTHAVARAREEAIELAS
ncbi:flippase-like domain-containing protein [Paractinoplanes deccanensis]|uniref:flippase-like domain-containing protein n=2 Tax=Paractinoplanes deccanensis TaxID=113561 RepID=UPI0031D41518